MQNKPTSIEMCLIYFFTQVVFNFLREYHLPFAAPHNTIKNCNILSKCAITQMPLCAQIKTKKPATKMGRFRAHSQCGNQAIIVLLKHLRPYGFASLSLDRFALNTIQLFRAKNCLRLQSFSLQKSNHKPFSILTHYHSYLYPLLVKHSS